MKKRNKSNSLLIHDFLMIFFGAVIAFLLVKTGLLDLIIDSTKGYYVLASFVSGIFFTSIFTIVPSSVSFVHISEYAPIQEIAFFGGLGAMCGDLILFFFIRDRFTEDLMNTIKPSTLKHILKSFHFGFLKWLSPLIAAFIIASPLPDEFGITLLGMSKVRTAVLMPLSFIMNMFGIYVLIGFSHLL